MLGYILMVLYIVSCFVLILFVLLQPGKSDASGMFGGGANSTAFGPRGTQTVLAKVTISAAIAFFLIAFLFSIPGLFDKRSIGERAGPAEATPATAPAPVDQTTPPEPSAAPPSADATPAPAKPAEQGSAKGAAAQSKDTKKTDAAKKP
ncbi:MAG TPA: preprotein translocase subunit SecG [Blastocatellia bacterium]|nr:preprotein translocase subunit SecG [Blastocatellia bacterium]